MSERHGVFTGNVAEVLLAAGWADSWDKASAVLDWTRKLELGFAIFPAAQQALRRFGGLRVEQRGPGEMCARETFVIDPLLALYEDDRFQAYASPLGTELYPLGEAAAGHVFLAISTDGRVFALMDEIWLIGNTIEAAIESLVRGRAAERLAIEPNWEQR